MAKSSKAKKKKGGPHLAAALFCERIIEDKDDGALSAIRIIDQINIEIEAGAPPDFPSETNRIPVSMQALLMFKTGDSPGNHTVRLVMESPSGKSQEVLERTIPFTQPPHGGANIRNNIFIGVKAGGLFRLHVYVDGKHIAHMPLEISVRRLPSQTQTSEAKGTKER
jgi:hypothetical protein